ncbi:MAG TPA: wax ester/triacylglycerol synthase family O-acyltransferase [Nocardioidaceae bacterium]|nr:wax ester/triacylglycerol synthase family O-acyltransferase [Nocardioidaceae bacterium]
MTRNLGLVDRIFLLQEAPKTPQHVGGLGVFSLPADAPPDYLERLVEGFQSSREFAEPFNYVLRHPSLKSVAPSFDELPAEDVDLEYHFRHNSLPRPGGERQLGVLVSRLHSSPLDLSRPLWEVHLIEGLSGGRFAIYLKLHHALFDGIAGARLMQKMLSTDPSDTAIRAPWTIGRKSSSRPKAAPPARTAAAREAAKTATGLVRRTAQLARQVVRPDRDLATPYRIPEVPFNGRVGQQRRVATQAVDFERVRALADRADVTINDVFLGICASGLRRYLDEAGALPELGLVAGTPVSVRLGSGDSSNNAFTIVTMNLWTDIEDPVERLRAINRSSTVTKATMDGMTKKAAVSFGALTFSPFVAQGLVGLGGRLTPPYNLVISNVPGPLEQQYLAGSALDMMAPLGLLDHGQGLFIAAFTISGRMGLGFVGDRDSLPHLQRLAVYTGEALDELEKEVAPSNAPRVRAKSRPKQ